jgi:hypothetical protein
LARRLSEHRHPVVRAEAIALLGRARPQAAAVRALVAALHDPDGRVRRRAAEALCQHGDRATALLRRPLRMVTAASVDAVWALARIGSRSARRLLAAYVRQLRDEVGCTLRLLDWISAAPDRARWSALELGLRDHQARIVDVILAALSPAIDIRLAGRVREALRGADQRRRASAFELIAAVPASRLAPGAAALLHVLLFDHRAGAGRVSGPEPDLQKTMCDQAMASMSPWVRYAAARRAARPAPGHRVLGPAGMAGPASSKHSGVREMDLDDQQLERIVALKRTPLFRYVPLETLAEVARTVQAQTYLAREEVITGGTSRQDLLILEAGALSIGHHDGAETLRAPACFGEIALAGERMPWPRITVVEEARVSFLRATIFEELCREHPEMALELCRLLARHLLRAGTTGAS